MSCLGQHCTWFLVDKTWRFLKRVFPKNRVGWQEEWGQMSVSWVQRKWAKARAETPARPECGWAPTPQQSPWLGSHGDVVSSGRWLQWDSRSNSMCSSVLAWSPCDPTEDHTGSLHVWRLANRNWRAGVRKHPTCFSNTRVQETEVPSQGQATTGSFLMPFQNER